MAPLPTPVRAALGFVATVVDEAKTLPDKAIEVPMLAVSRALKFSLRAQQRYSSLAARGDEVLAGRQVGDDPPAWATFDEPVDDPVIEPADGRESSARTNGSTGPAPRRPRPAKTVRTPRNAAPSAFDSVVDEE